MSWVAPAGPVWKHRDEVSIFEFRWASHTLSLVFRSSGGVARISSLPSSTSTPCSGRYFWCWDPHEIRSWLESQIRCGCQECDDN